jgi:4-amino-4-deoxy-L-arabinose transferase-like glycosyltransferase
MPKIDELKVYRLVLWTASICFFLLFLYVSLSRMAFPFELEWMEGGSVEQMDRLMKGQEIYTPPSIEYIPYIYTPMYYYVSAAIASFTGVSLLPMRIVSFISTLIIGLIFFFFARNETGDKLSGIMASGLFFAAFGIGGAWYDLARVDMLWLMFYIAGVYLLYFHKTPKSYLFAGILIGLSFLTKQTTLMLIAPICLYLLFRERKLSWWFNIILALIVVLSTAYYIYTSNGWYYFWNFTLPADHRWTKKVFVLFWTFDVIRPMAIALLFTISLLIIFIKNKLNDKFYFFLSLLSGSILASWLSRLHYGGWLNVLIPIYLILCLMAPIGLSYVFDKIKNSESNVFIKRIFLIGMIFQFIILIYSPFLMIPTKEDVNAGWELVGKLKNTKGDVYIGGNIYYARLAEKKVFTHFLLIMDLMQSSTKFNKSIEQDLLSALQTHKFDMIVTYSDMLNVYPKLSENYKIHSKANDNPQLLWMKTGYNTRAEEILIPKNNFK